MGRGLALAALALAAGAAIASAAVPAPSDFRTSAFVCPAAAMTNTSCACTSGCSINSEFSYLWSNPVYPPPMRWLGPDTVCGAITLPCTPKAADLGAYLGLNGYVRGTSVTGFHFFIGCAPGALVTIYTGFTGAECELLRIRYASLERSDPDTAYPVPLLCNTNDCNFSPGEAVGTCTAGGGGSSSGALPTARRGGAAAVAAATALAVALAGALQ